MPQLLHETKVSFWEKIKGRKPIRCVHMTDGSIHWNINGKWKKDTNECALTLCRQELEDRVGRL